jgi:hypothetical protein
MTLNLREHSRTTSHSIKVAADGIRQDIGDQLRVVMDSLPDGFRQLPLSERRAVIADLQAGLITWTTEIEPVARELRALLRELYNEL